MPRFPTKEQLTAPFQSKQAFKEFIEAPKGEEITIGQSRWTNVDLEPTREEYRNWTWYSLPLYWFSNQFSLVGWNTGASLIAVGLTWQNSFASAVLGAFLASVIVVFMARPGVKYHVGYPVLARASMGMYGSFFFVFIRACVCIIWYGIQTFYGASILSVMLRCIFGGSWSNFKNTLPGDADVTSKILLSFFIVWLLEFPFMWVHPRHIHYLFTVKGATMPIAAFAIFGWCLKNGGGIHSLTIASQAAQESKLGIPLGWSIMSGINVIMGSLSPMVVNQPDLSRYCKTARDAGPLQGVSVFVASVIVFFLGLASTTSIQSVWGVAYWNIWDLLDAILDHHWNGGARAGVFFLSFAFLLGVFATNFGANSIPFGSDMTGLFPKYLTIKRGQVLCAILGVVVVPWKLIASASAFLSFLGSYNIFMAPLCAVIVGDYLFVRRGNIHVPSLYDGTPGALYWYWSGVNWVGALSWLAGVSMGIPGLIGQYRPDITSEASKRMYMMGWILTYVTAAVVHFVATRFIKAKVFPAGREDTPFEREWLANNGREGYYEGEREGEIYAPPTPTGSNPGSQLGGLDGKDEKGMMTSIMSA